MDLTYIFSAIIPIIICVVVIYSVVKRVPAFDIFTEGAKEGLQITAKILPTLICLICAVSMLRASGAFELIAYFLKPVISPLNIPAELIPLAIMKPLSGSGSLAVVNDILNQTGADSFTSFTASVMASSTETTFYAISVYFGSIGIKKTRHTLIAATIGDITAFVAALLFSKLFYNMF